MAFFPLTLCFVFGSLAALQKRPGMAASLGALVVIIGFATLHGLAILCGLAIGIAGPFSVKATEIRWKRFIIVGIAIAVCWIPSVAGALSHYRLARSLRPY